MNLEEDIKLYLPQYLSEEGMRSLLNELDKFPTDGTKDTVYTSILKNSDYLMQGDGIGKMPITIKDKQKNIPSILISNTCDMSLTNKRLFPIHIEYVPLINYEKYSKGLYKIFNKVGDKERVDNHLKQLKNQKITQLLFLPKGENLNYDAIALLDMAFNLPEDEDTIKKMIQERIFTLSNFGFYLFLLKISMHFTRIQEKVDRYNAEDRGLKS